MRPKNSIEKANKLKICKFCKINFFAKRVNCVFCSQKCWDKCRGQKNKIKSGKYKKCPWCKKKKYIIYSKLIWKKHFCCRNHYILFTKKNSFNFPCKVCRKKIYTQPSQLKLKRRSTCSPECRTKLARIRAEERHKTYDKRKLNILVRRSLSMIRWRKAVFARDNWTCRECGEKGCYLEAHHIKPFAYFPELRFVLSNGATLCRRCHDKTKISASKLKKIYGKKHPTKLG